MLFELSAFLLCLFYLYHAILLPFGSLEETGPGFVPVLLGVLGTFIAGVLLLNSAMEVRNHSSLTQKLLHGRSLDLGPNRDLFLYLATLIAFIVVFDLLGGVLALFLLTASLSKICGLRGWLRPMLLSIVTTACLYVVFDMAFRISLPSGILRLIS